VCTTGGSRASVDAHADAQHQEVPQPAARQEEVGPGPLGVGVQRVDPSPGLHGVELALLHPVVQVPEAEGQEGVPLRDRAPDAMPQPGRVTGDGVEVDPHGDVPRSGIGEDICTLAMRGVGMRGVQAFARRTWLEPVVHQPQIAMVEEPGDVVDETERCGAHRRLFPRREPWGQCQQLRGRGCALDREERAVARAHEHLDDSPVIAAAESVEGQVVQELVGENTPTEPKSCLVQPLNGTKAGFAQRRASCRAPLHRRVASCIVDFGRERSQQLASKRAIGRSNLDDVKRAGAVQELPELLDLPSQEGGKDRGEVRARDELASLSRSVKAVETLLRVVESCLHELGEGDRAIRLDPAPQPVAERAIGHRFLLCHHSLVSIRAAATVIVARERPPSPQQWSASEPLEYLVLRRAPINRFAPGFVVFPGGVVEEADRRRAEEWFGTAEEMSRACAVRELAEETGLILTSEGLVAARGRSPGDPGVAPPSVERLPELARWIAPEFLPVRFDARFFGVAAGQLWEEPSADDVEVDAVWWSSTDDLLRAHTAGGVQLMWPTLKMLESLATCRSVADVLALRVEQVAPPISL
jgi:8-oxo-dGTP pyrophosphatase MutT (NUDIX family)